MRPIARSAVCTFLLWFGCSPPPVVNDLDIVDLGVVSLSPAAVDPAKATALTLTLTNGCAVADLQVTIGGLPIDGIVEGETNVYAMQSPVVLVRVPTKVLLVATCGKTRDPATQTYGVKSAQAELTFDPALEFPPEVISGSPVGTRVSVRAEVTVTFSGEVDPGTVDASTFSIEGIPGRVQYAESTKVATFRPDRLLANGTEYAVRVLGVKSRSGAALKASAINGSTATEGVRWTFRTRSRGEGSPWTRDMPSAGGQVASANGGIRAYTSTGALGTSGVLSGSGGAIRVRSGVVATTVPTVSP